MNCIRTSFPVAGALLVTLLAACAGTTEVKAPPPTSQPITLDRAVVLATDEILTQARAAASGSTADKTLVIDPLIDGATGEQTVAMQAIEQQIGGHVRSNHRQWRILPFAPRNVSQAQYLMVGTLNPTAPSGPGRAVKLSLSLTELKTGLVVAQSNVLIIDQGLDRTPTRYHRDSPVPVRDPSTDAYARTAETKPGDKADPGYIGNVVTSALIGEANKAYNEGRYLDALELYTRAAAAPGGEQLRVFLGLYLTNWRLGRVDAAEKAFGDLVALGVAKRDLGMKILFRPGSTDFWPDPMVSGPYPFWFRQISRHVSASKMCLHLVGHASRTGTEEFNDRLSLQRAALIRQRLESESPSLSRKMRITGMGYWQNLSGKGTDDLYDAEDRRVEFKVIKCP